MHDKKSPLNVSEIQACKDIFEKPTGPETEDSNPSEAVSRNVAAANLEKEELDILLKQMEHDLKTYALWQLKCEDREAAMYHAELAQKTFQASSNQKKCERPSRHEVTRVAS